MSEIINLADRRPAPSPGNGAREAVTKFFETREYERYLKDRSGVRLSETDYFLAYLWLEGFKIVPTELKGFKIVPTEDEAS